MDDTRGSRHRGFAIGRGLLAALLLAAAGTAAAQSTTQLPKRFIVRFDDADTQRAAAAINLIDKAGIDSINSERAGGLARLAGHPLRYRHTLASGSMLVEADVADAKLEGLLRTAQFGSHKVRYVEPDRVMTANALPNDPNAVSQWDLQGPADGQVAGVNATAAWPLSTGAGVNVAIIDTGYTNHPDLAGQVVSQYDFISDAANANDGDGRDADAHDTGDYRNAGDCGSSGSSSSSWHGTHVAGTIAALTNNGTGVAGIAYNAHLVIARVLGKCGGYTSDIADAIVWSSGGSVPGVPDNGFPAQVINMSLGGQYSCSQSPETQNAINLARGRGTSVVVAAGNSNADAGGFTPAGCSGVISVAAVGPSGTRAYYSNYGASVSVAAPGGDESLGQSAGILSTINLGATTLGSYGYAWYQGTSMASPHVAGVVALMYALQPSLTPDQVLTALKASARPFPSGCTGCGAGLVDAAQVLAQVVPADVLRPGVPVAGISGSSTSSRLWTMTIPANAKGLSLTLTAGTGSAQLYLRRGAAPTTTAFDCMPTASGAVQTCAITGAITAGTYYFAVRGVTDFSGYTLLANYTQTSPGTLAFSATNYAVTEAATTVTVSVTRSGGSDGAVSVSYATSNGTATAGADYTAKSGTLSWAAGDSAAKTFAVTILNDTIPEATETVNLKLSTPTNGAALGAQANATISIADDSDSNPGSFSFSAASYTVNEAGPTVTITVRRVDGAKGAVTVAYATADGSAKAGSDYTAKTGTLTWANGDTANKSFAIAITNDLIAESAESFGVVLSNPTGGATLGSIASASVNIVDNDTAPGTLAFSVASASVSEGAGTATITVNRSGGSGGAVSVHYATSNGTAMASASYTASSGTLSWDAGDAAAKTFTVPIVDDGTWLGNRSFTLTLASPTGGAVLGTQQAETVTIVDNDNNAGRISFSASSYSVGEGGGTVTITAKRVGGSLGAVSASFATLDGTALAGSDYLARTGILNWAAGDTANKTFTVGIVNDTVKESTETFGLALSNATGGAVIDGGSASVSIVDND